VRILCTAARRGVRVRLMLPSMTDVPVMLTAARSFYEQMLGAGIDIYERQAVTLHAKTLVIDGAISVLGSTNFDYRSIDYNCELAAVIRSAEFGRQMQMLFEHDVRCPWNLLCPGKCWLTKGFATGRPPTGQGGRRQGG
jgi:cardiolipin synthase